MGAPQYAFRDTDLARQRLELVADVFAAPSTAFLQQEVGFRPQLALDLGCGPGRTTHLLAGVTDAQLVVGMDISEAFLGVARRRPSIAFVRADITSSLPVHMPDLIYCRLLLAHLPEPQDVIGTWVQQLRPGGLLLLDEVEWIHTDNPGLAVYEQIVTAMVGSRGAHISVGPYITGLGGEGWGPRSDTLCRYDVTTADAARMYAMNLATWRHDPFVVDTYETATIDDLAAGLNELTRSSATHEIEWGLRQVVYERTASGGR